MNPTLSGSRSKLPIFQLYKALRGIFQKHTENRKGKPKIH